MTNLPTQRGYTLLEMTVAVGLFSLVMLLATGAFLNFISLDRKARYTNDVVNNLSFAVDSMARSIRTGHSYECGGLAGSPNCWPPSAGRNSFAFIDDQGREVTYLIKTDGSIGVCAYTSTQISQGATCTAANAITLTDKRVTVQSLTFYVQGVGSESPPKQPMVLISIRGYMKPDQNSANIEYAIETMAVQRLIEL